LADWLAKALECFPELLDGTFQNRYYDHPGDLWIDLRSLLWMAYENQANSDDLIGRIYDYATWCFEQPQTKDVETDLSSATAVGLIEDIPLNPRVSGDLHRWMSVESFEGFKSLFRYHLSDEAYCTFHDEFMRKKKTYSGPSRL